MQEMSDIIVTLLGKMEAENVIKIVLDFIIFWCFYGGQEYGETE